VLRPAGRDRYYLDEAAVIAQRASAPKHPPRGVILVIGLLLLVRLVAVGALHSP
jgi:hypothetical protein